MVDAVGAGERALSLAEADALMALSDRQTAPPMAMGFRCVKFNSQCGVIQAGGVSIEILPKIADDEAFSRGALLKMLALASGFPLAKLDAQQVRMQSHTLLQCLIRWFCDELFEQFHPGLLREYVLQSTDLAAIRGRWRPELDALRFPGRKDRLSCEFDELTADNRYNRALKAALRVVGPLARGAEGLHRDVTLLRGWLDDVEDAHVTADQVRRLPVNRLVARYRHALQLAEWFLASQAPDLRSGGTHGLALLFDMNSLFQSCLAAGLRRVLPDALRLREEAPRHFLTTDSGGARRFQMKPDLCILAGETIVAIIDAKWKRVSRETDSERWAIQQADVYQLHAYATAYACNRVALWYPGNSDLEAIQDRPEFTFLTEGRAPTGRTLGIDWIQVTPSATDPSWLWFFTRQVQAAWDRLSTPLLTGERS